MSLITLTDPRSPASEAYRTLRTNLSFYSLDTPLRTLVVTTPAAGEDNGETIANLAVTMAQGGKSTIVVDCNLRRPVLHQLFNLKAEPGLTNSLLSNDKLPLQAVPQVAGLSLLAAGSPPPNPADLLGSRRIDQILEDLRGQADMILFHAPPVVAVTDAVVLGSKADGVLLVVTAGKTRRDHAEKAKETLQKANVRLVGATLVNAPKDNSIGTY